MYLSICSNHVFSSFISATCIHVITCLCVNIYLKVYFCSCVPFIYLQLHQISLHSPSNSLHLIEIFATSHPEIIPPAHFQDFHGAPTRVISIIFNQLRINRWEVQSGPKKTREISYGATITPLFGHEITLVKPPFIYFLAIYIGATGLAITPLKPIGFLRAHF